MARPINQHNSLKRDPSMSNRVMNHDTAGEALLHTMLGNDVADISPSASRAQKFCWGFPSRPEAAPLICGAMIHFQDQSSVLF